MRNLLNFLLKYNYWFLFILLEVASFVLLFRFNRYQQSAFFTSANTVVGAVYEVSGGISSYFHLKSVNEDLLDRNMVLEQQITNLEKALREQQLDSMAINSIRQVPQADYQLFKAHVIKNSLNLVDNYITLDKGSSSGIRSEMGVVDGNVYGRNWSFGSNGCHAFDDNIYGACHAYWQWWKCSCSFAIRRRQ